MNSKPLSLRMLLVLILASLVKGLNRRLEVLDMAVYCSGLTLSFSDFDECEAGQKCEQDEFCFNTYGSHRCMPKLRCPSDYQQMSAT